MINKTIADEFRPSRTDPDPDSLHQWNALVEGHKSACKLFSLRASDTIKEWVKKRLQATLDFIIPTQRDGTRFHGELDLKDAKKEFKTRRRAEFTYDEISNQWDICSLFNND
ncbi:hypothetical protein BDR03DRAFT_1016956 [Suillus americanus]|nr:hypothetical protein BDR03DRAFT_1016956 [Suillus americanus]